VAATVGGEDSGGNGDGGADEKSEESELERGGIALKDDAADRRLELEGLAEVAAEKLLEIVAVCVRSG
jgi:hypothetical protein